MLVIEPPFQDLVTDCGLHDEAGFIRHFLGDSAGSNGKTQAIVRRETLGQGGQATDVYFKLYTFKRPAWNFVGRHSKARREFDNYRALQALGIPVATPIAFGETRDWCGRLVHAFILTQTVPRAATLVDYFESRAARPDASVPALSSLRKRILSRLATQTRLIHQGDFFHHDLVWRNILLAPVPDGESDPEKEPELWWIDCPRGRFDRGSPWRHRRRLRDLGSLDKTHSRYCTRSERLWFFKQYLGMDRLKPEGKALIRDVLAYRKRRWPDDQEGL